MNSASPGLNNIVSTPHVRVLVGVLFTMLAFVAHARGDRIRLSPKLHAGQTLTYYVTIHTYKLIYAESSVISATPPSNDAKLEVRSLLRIEILGLQPRAGHTAIHARAYFAPLDSDSSSKPSSVEPGLSLSQPSNANPSSVEFTLFPDGHVDNLTGADALSPDQQQAWQEWLSRFALAAGFPPSGAKLSQRWKSVQLEQSPSPIAGLRWLRESTYVGDEPCPSLKMNAQGDLISSDARPDTCAVILTTATLKQKSSPANATPETFKLHELRTAGAARGTNRIITYISFKTGLVVRATEEDDQDMDVTIAKADRSNRVRYNVAAKSHSEVLLISETPSN